jgi:hypothetical protein
MEKVNACEDEDILMERLVRVENALFCLKVKSRCFNSWDNSEVERLESLRRELHERYARAHSPALEARQRPEMAASS